MSDDRTRLPGGLVHVRRGEKRLDGCDDGSWVQQLDVVSTWNDDKASMRETGCEFLLFVSPERFDPFLGLLLGDGGLVVVGRCENDHRH